MDSFDPGVASTRQGRGKPPTGTNAGTHGGRWRRLIGALVALGLTAVLAFSASLLAPSGAAAAPSGIEFPTSWALNGQTATGTTPSGIVVTATVAGPAVLSLTGALALTGSAPAYFPSTGPNQVLRVDITNCTANCGSITYTFSQPVKAPVLDVGDVGAGMADQNFNFVAYHDAPITLTVGAFSLDSPGSQSAKIAITNNGSTIGIGNPDAQIGQSMGTASSCETFGCGSYDISTPTRTITSLSMSLGYAGTGTNLDGMTFLLGVVPAPATVQIAKTSIDSPGTFTFSGMTNLSNTTDSVTTTAPGIPAVSGQINKVGSVGSPVAITEDPSAGFGFAGVACVDANAAITGNSNIAASVSGTTVTVPAANIVPDASITCTFTNAANHPALSLVKSADKTSFTIPGEVVAYSFLVTNTGNTTVTGVGVADSQAAPAGALDGPVTCPTTAGSLAPKATVTCSGTYTVTQSDVDHGQLADAATAAGTGPGNTPVVSNTSTVKISAAQAPGLSLVKSADKKAYAAPGEMVSYSFVVTNTGNTTVTAVGVSDSQSAPAGALDGPVTCPAAAASLAPKATVTCTGTYTVTQADVDHGQLADTATASGTGPGNVPVVSNSSDLKISATQTQALSLVKSADKKTYTAPGELVSYSFLVTNTGNTTVTHVGLTDALAAPAGALDAPVTCPATAAFLAPKATVTCTGTYKVTQADVDHGALADTATASGTGQRNTPVASNASTVKIPATQAPALKVTKTPSLADTNGDDLPDQGDTVAWAIIVTNTGNTTLTGLQLSDPTAGTPVCHQTTLAPGKSISCTVPAHTVTSAEAAAGHVANTVTATAKDPNGKDVSDKSNDTVDVMVLPMPPAQGPAEAPTSAGAALAYTGSIIQAILPWALGITAAGLLTILAIERRTRIERQAS